MGHQYFIKEQPMKIEFRGYEVKNSDWEQINPYFRFLLYLFGSPENGTLELLDEVGGVKLSVAVESAINKLPPALYQIPKDRPREVIRLRFGLRDGHTMTLKAIGENYSLTPERIRQIESSALRMLRHSSGSKELKRYIQRI